jgi:hypothetical protein
VVPMVAVHLIEGPGVGPTAPPVWPLYMGNADFVPFNGPLWSRPGLGFNLESCSYRLRTAGDGIWYAPALY